MMFDFRMLNKSYIYVLLIVCICVEAEKRVEMNKHTIIRLNSLVSRTPVCGDSIVQSGEICDDGNNLAQDGCSPICTLEDGYMCYSSRRSPDASTLGTMVAWTQSTNNTQKPQSLSVLETAESCTSENICQYEHKWQSELWQNVYGNGSNTEVLPPSGYYCNSFCTDTFTPPMGYEFKDSCQLTTVDECIRGWTTCDINAYCLQPPNGIGYSCRCDADFFVSALGGTGCDESGIELVINVTGGFEGEVVDHSNIQIARENIIIKLFDLGYIKQDKSNLQLVLEGVLDYPLEIVESNLVNVEFSGRVLWRIILRIPSEHVDIQLFANGPFLNDYTAMGVVLSDSEKYRLHFVQRCSNDNRRTCADSAECLSEGVCMKRPDASVRILSAGGSTAPIVMDASGSSIISVNYDKQYAAFKIRMR